MRYIPKILSAGEKVVILSRPHWIYAVQGVFWGLLLVALGFAADHYAYLYYGRNATDFKVDLGLITFTNEKTPIPWLLGLSGLMVFIPYFTAYVTQEIALTSQRIIHKRGLFNIKVDEVDLDDIRAEHVSHGWLGWLLGYGAIRMNCRFIEDINLPAIGKPYRFVKASHKARLTSPSASYDETMFQTNMKKIEDAQQTAQNKMHARYLVLQEKMKSNFRRAAH